MSHKTFLLFCGLWIILLPTSQSLWTDEALTAQWASQPSLGHLLNAFLQDKNSEAQMPLYILLSWFNGQLFGTSEWQLRAQNIPWGMMAVYWLFLTGKRIGIAWLPVLVVLSPFFVFYMDEARPYAMQIGIACWLLYAMVDCLESDGRGESWIWHLGVSGLLLCLSSMLGVITLGVVCVVLIVTFILREWKIERKQLCILGGFIGLLGLSGIYYVWTLAKGAGGARVWTPDLYNLGFSLFEFSGASGLTAPRYIIRSLARAGDYQTLKQTVAGPIVFFGSIYVFIFGLFLFHFGISKHRQLWLHLLYVVCGSFGTLGGLSLLIKWPFWGRHLAPAFPFVATLVAISLLGVVKSAWRKTGIILGGLLGIGLVASSVNLRFGLVPSKEDYRGVAALAKRYAEEGDLVWWAASLQVGSYYKIPFKKLGSEPAGILDVHNLGVDKVSMAGIPDIIILSKQPDLFDSSGVISDVIKQRHFVKVSTASGFDIYRGKSTRRP